MGRINAISTSKIKKIIAIKKNRIEKGRREEEIGSNPHSNGEAFSRSIVLFFDNIDAKILTIIAIANTITAMQYKLKITYTKLYLDLVIGSHIYFYTI